MFPTDPDVSRWTILRQEPEFTIAQLILWFFVALTSLQVIMRYVFDAPLQWPEELTQILQELRNRYVYISDLVAKQMTAGAAGGASEMGGQPNISTPDLTS